MFINTNVLILIILIFVSLYFISYFKKISVIEENFDNYNIVVRSCPDDCNNNFKYNIVLPNNNKLRQLVNMYEKNTCCNPGYTVLSPGFWD